MFMKNGELYMSQKELRGAEFNPNEDTKLLIKTMISDGIADTYEIKWVRQPIDKSKVEKNENGEDVFPIVGINPWRAGLLDTTDVSAYYPLAVVTPDSATSMVIPTLVLASKYNLLYLHPFRGYRFRLSGSIHGDGVYGMSSNDQLENFDKDRLYIEAVVAMFDTCCNTGHAKVMHQTQQWYPMIDLWLTECYNWLQNR